MNAPNICAGAAALHFPHKQQGSPFCQQFKRANEYNGLILNAVAKTAVL